MTMMTWWWPQATARSQAVWPLWFSMKRSAPWPTRNSTHLSIKRAVYGVSLCVQCSWCAKSELENGKPGLFRKKCKQDEPFKARLGGVMKSGVACHVPANNSFLSIILTFLLCSDHFCRTILVFPCHWLNDLLTNSPLFSGLDWCDFGWWWWFLYSWWSYRANVGKLHWCWGLRIRTWSLVEIWMLKLGQDSEARSRILSWILVEILNLKWAQSWWRLWGWSLVDIPKLILINLWYDLLWWKRSNFGSIVPLAMFHLKLNKSYIHPSTFGPNIQTPQRLNSSKVNFETGLTFFVLWGNGLLTSIKILRFTVGGD